MDTLARHGPTTLPDGIDWALIDAQPGRLGVAVSGGGDSVALAVLLREARPDREVVLLTVDHGLRPGAAADCDFVERLGARLGVPVERLEVRSAPHGSLQAWAREERYALFADAAEALGLSAVLTGHTLDDQAETLLLRLARGSGVRGLGAMRARTRRGALLVLRPLLGIGREALRDALRARGIDWREDPSNTDARYDRVQMRALAPELAAVGLTAARLAAAARHLARASEAIDAAADGFMRAAMRVDAAGAVRLARAPWEATPDEVRLRVLATAVQVAGGASYPPRFDVLERADARARSGEPSSLGRACLAVEGADLVLWREDRALLPLVLGPGDRGVWDGRYRVTAAADAPELVVHALGGAAGRILGNGRGVATAPGAYVDGVLVAAPTFGLRRFGVRRDIVRVTRVR